MKKVVLFSAFVSLVGLVNAQTDSTHHDVVAKIVTKDPNPNFFQFDVRPFVLDVFPTNTAVSGEIGIRGKMNQLFYQTSIKIGYKTGLEEGMFNRPSDATSAYKDQMPMQFDLFGGYILSTTEDQHKMHFRLHSGKHANTMARMTGVSNKFQMLELGVKSGFRPYHLKGSTLTYTSTVGTFDQNNAQTYLSYTNIEAGISFGEMGFWDVDFQGVGRRHAEIFNRIYVHAIYMATSKLDPVLQDVFYGEKEAGKYFAKYDINSSKMSRIGLCGGYSVGNVDKLGYSVNFETGYYPGIKGDFASHFGISVGLGFSINKHILAKK